MPSLHHVALETPPGELGRAIEFWGLLGFRQVEAPADVAEYVRWVEREGAQIHLIAVPEATVPPIGHAAVVTPAIETAVAALSGAGFEVEPRRELWGEARAVATAPGGHRIELMAAPPPASA